MQNKRGVAVAAFIAVVSMILLFCGGVSVWASVTMYVDSSNLGPSLGTQYAPFHTINEALDEAKSGDTIIVASGTYNEAVPVTVDDLTILGPNAGVSAGVNVGDRKAEAVITGGLTINAKNTMIDGFAIQAIGITVENGKSGSVIANNVFFGPAGVNAISLDTNANITITNNCFENWDIGIESSKSTRLSITGNVFANNTVYGVEFSESTIEECSGNAFRNNGTGFYAKKVKAGLALHSNSFQGNAWAVENGDPDDEKTIDIDARNNWWGDVSGPSWAGPGFGDRVSRNVLFDPWLIYDPSPWFPPPAGVTPVSPTGDPETDVVDETLRAQVVKPGQKNVILQNVVVKDPGGDGDKIGDRHPTDISIVTIKATELLAENGRIDKISLVVDSNENGTFEPGQDVVLAYRTLAFADPAVNWFVQTDSVTFGVRGKKLLQVPDKGEVRLFVVADISPTARIGERIHTSVFLEAEDDLSSPGSMSSNFEDYMLPAEASFDTIAAFATGDKEANLIDETKSASIINGQKQVVIQEFVLQDPDGGIDSTSDGHPTWIHTMVVRSTAGSTITAEDIDKMWIVEETDGIPGYSIGDWKVEEKPVAGQQIDLKRDGVRFGDPLRENYPFIGRFWQEARFYIVADFKDSLKDGDWLKVETKVTTSDPYNVSWIDPQNNPYDAKSSDIENPNLVASNGVVMGAASGSGIPQVGGDVNGDGKVDVSDVRLVSRFILKVNGSDLSAAQKIAADVAPPHIPPDTNIDVTDVRWLSQVALGLKTLSAKAVNVNPLATSTSVKLEIDQDGRLNVSGTASAIADLQGRLLFDPAVLHITEVIGLNGFTVLGSTIDNDKGAVRFIVANLSTQPALERAVMQFVTNGDPTQAVVYMEVLRDVQARNVPYQFRGRLSNLEFGHSPNPVTDVHTATFEVTGPMATLVEAIKVQIFDLSGRLVYESVEVYGTSLDWHTDNNYGEYLANGAYLYKLYALLNDQWAISKTKMLVILR